MRAIAVGFCMILATTASWSANAADGVLSGFGNVPFGSSLDAAKVADGVEVREESCTENTCQLVYRTTAAGLAVTVWQQFTDGAAVRAEVLIRSPTTGGRHSNVSNCDRDFHRIFGLLEARYGAADVPIVLRDEPGPNGEGVFKVREVTFTFANGATIREKRDAGPDATCGLRLFYRPGFAASQGVRF